MTLTQSGRLRRGMTLLELMIVVSIVGLLAVLAMPSFFKSRLRAQDRMFINQLRLLSSETFETYAMQNGDFPPDAPAGVVPPGVAEYLPRRFDWTKATPIGGQWDWERAARPGEKIFGIYAGVSVYRPSRTSAQMRAIDAEIDDGNLVTGTFRWRMDRYICTVQD